MVAAVPLRPGVEPGCLDPIFNLDDEPSALGNVRSDQPSPVINDRFLRHRHCQLGVGSGILSASIDVGFGRCHLQG